MGEDIADSIVNSFDYANLDLQFESASSLENYPQTMKNLKTIKLNDDFNKIKPLLGNKVTYNIILVINLLVWQTRLLCAQCYG